MKVKLYRTILDGCRYPSLVSESGNYVCDGRKAFNNADVIYDFCVRQLGMSCAAEEYAYCFALDMKCHLMGMFEISHGNVNGSIVSAREVFQKLLMLGATGFILVHNHPSGDSTPSKEDADVTERLRKAGELMGINLVDHIVIGDGNYYSFTQEGR